MRIDGVESRDPRYVHRDDLALLDTVADGGWHPRTSILSPFDNLICLRDRTYQLFDFAFLHENYVPKAKRKYGVYVMPILSGDRLVGRVAPKMDREHRRLVVEGVHSEAPRSASEEIGREIDEQVRSLARFLGTDDVVYPSNVPEHWRAALR